MNFNVNENDKAYILILNGGLGARIIQTTFIRSLIRKRKQEDNNYPILVMDNSLIGHMVSSALNDQNVHGIQLNESPANWPNDSTPMLDNDSILEHPMFIDSWRENMANMRNKEEGSMFKLVNNNWDRTYSIEYSFSLTKMIHQNKLKDNKDAFICNLYGKNMGLEYDGGVPMLNCTEENEDLANYMNSQTKPVVLLHLGVDKNPNDFNQGINYRFHKVWSLRRWSELALALKDKFTFLQVHANQFNPTLPGIDSIKVENLNPVLQILKHPNCAFHMSIDNYLPHLSASLKKKGIVLWGSVSPYVWGWDHNINIWNKFSCPEIACWRPGMFDKDNNGKLFVCDHYSCMKSITVRQVIENIEKIESFEANDVQNKLVM